MDLNQQIAALPTTSTAKLRAKCQRGHGIAPPAGLGQLLLARGIAYKL